MLEEDELETNLTWSTEERESDRLPVTSRYIMSSHIVRLAFDAYLMSKFMANHDRGTKASNFF